MEYVPGLKYACLLFMTFNVSLQSGNSLNYFTEHMEIRGKLTEMIFLELKSTDEESQRPTTSQLFGTSKPYVVAVVN